MKNKFAELINMVYPMLISLFIFCFVSAFVKGELLEPLQLTLAILSVVFGLIFVIGLVFYIISLFKKKNQIQ